MDYRKCLFQWKSNKDALEKECFDGVQNKPEKTASPYWLLK